MIDVNQSIRVVSEQLAEEAQKGRQIVYVGRFCPMHIGHQAMIGGMIGAAPENHLLFVGSCNQPLSHRNMFGFVDRANFIRTVFPEVRLAALPDFADDTSWFEALDCSIRLTGKDPVGAVFIGGNEEEVQWYRQNNRRVIIVDRFSGVTTNISGKEIRRHLIAGDQEKLKTMLDPWILEPVMERFKEQYAKLEQL